MKPICVPCQRFYRPKRTGYYFVEGMPKVNGALPGKAEPELWQPYKLWAGDLYACPDCGSEVVVGMGERSLSEHFMPEFQAQVLSLAGDDYLLVKDC